MKKLIVTNTPDSRLDHYLVEHLEMNRSTVTNLIKDGLVFVNGKITKPGYKLTTNDEVTINLEDKVDFNPLKPQDINLDIVYEDDDIMVINKPKGLVVHPSETFTETTLVSGTFTSYK